ncbi:chymotrypsin-like elastase family member 3B [Ochotona princeps]|uniref:chymotrypsin-like elastase family member 3B n=1 Tax=Ochotona princeps TaxID=9978 RepID=UPI002714E530|nr:chymotrypsin-like elastase family member 3B [Ochotona princeps]
MSALTGTVRILPVKSYVLHEKYNGVLNDGYDIALIELSRSAELTTWVQPACLPSAGYITPNGTECYVTGWGFISTSGPASDTLLEGLLCVLDHEHCSQPDYWGDNVNKRQLCAGECGSSACLGDSGGPLNCPGVNTVWEVHGIVSFGSARGCNYPKEPTVFTRVSCFIDWIEEVRTGQLGGLY